MDNLEKNEILEAIGNLNGKIDIIQNQITEMKKNTSQIPEIEKEVAKISGIEKEVAKLPRIEREVAKISGIENEILKIPGIEQEIRRMSRSIAIIEEEHGKKLSALFDAFTSNSEKLSIHEERINICEKHIEKHDDQIYYLNSKTQAL